MDFVQQNIMLLLDMANCCCCSYGVLSVSVCFQPQVVNVQALFEKKAAGSEIKDLWKKCGKP